MQRRVLIADSDDQRFSANRQHLERAGCQVLRTDELGDAPTQHPLWPPDALVLTTVRPDPNVQRNLLDHTPSITVADANDSLIDHINEHVLSPGTVLHFGERTAFLHRLLVTSEDDESKLTAIEADLLAYLTMHPQRAIHRSQLLQRVWGYNANVASRAVDSTVKRLRKKIEADPKNPKHLITVFGVGYRLVEYGTETTDPRPGPVLSLPATRPQFFGRTTEINRITEAFQEGRNPVTLRGFGGAGKTTLARYWSETSGLKSRYFVELSEARSEQDVLFGLAKALKIPLSVPRTDLVSALQAALRALKTGLVVLDNCEQVREAVREVLVQLLDSAPFRWLATSREPLSLPNEYVISVDALDETDAVALFRSRVEALGLGPLPAEHETRISDLVQALDRLPLAVELAAAKIGVLTVPDIIERLQEQRSDWADPDRPARHQTLRASLQWSWELLTVPEQRALAQCAVFRGGFTLGMAEQLIDVGSALDVTEVIAALQKRSLIHSRDDGRLFLLDVTAAFAEEELNAMGEVDATRTRHAEAIAAHCTRLRNRHIFRSWQPIRALEQERQNLRAALDASVSPDIQFELYLALDWIYILAGPTSARQPLFDTLAPPAQISAGLRYWYWYKMAELSSITRHSGALEQSLEAGYQEALKTKDAGTVVLYLRDTIKLLRSQGADATQWLERLDAQCSDKDADQGTLAFCRGQLLEEGDPKGADQAYRRAASLLPPADQPYLAAYSWYRCGFTALNSGRHGAAERAFFQCLSIIERHDEPTALGLQAIVALPALSRGETNLAVEILAESLEWVTENGNLKHVAEDHFALGLCHHLIGDHDLAREHYLQTLHIREQVAPGGEVQVTQALLGAVEAHVGNKRAARKWIALATGNATRRPDQNAIISCCDELVRYALGPTETAKARASSWLQEHKTSVPDARLGWVMQLLERAVG